MLACCSVSSKLCIQYVLNVGASLCSAWALEGLINIACPTLESIAT